jgi:hypothetical protein
MSLFDFIFKPLPYPPEHKAEVGKLITELIQIGKTDDFLSERPGRPFNAQCRHVRAREIGLRLNNIGGVPLMEMAYRRVKKSLGVSLASHLEYAWSEIGSWLS